MCRRIHSKNVSLHKQVEMVTVNFTKMRSGTIYLYHNPMHLCHVDIKQKQNLTHYLILKYTKILRHLHFL